jgi:preprotein translocase subunit SecE
MKNNPVVQKMPLSGVISELKKVTWPSRRETINLTLIVVAISLIVGFYIGIIDILLTKLLELFTK